MFQHFLKLIKTIFVYLIRLPVILCYRVSGIQISHTAKISMSSKLAGEVVIGERVVIDKNVLIKGKVHIGSGSLIEQNVVVIGNVDIGDSTVIGSCTILSTAPKGFLKIGNDVQINSFSVLGASEKVEIRDHCIFAPYIQITDASHGFEEPEDLIKHAAFATSPVTIENNVWLGSGVVILKGVTVGEGAVVGAKALVTKSVPSFSIAYGIPARVMRTRGGKSK